MQRSPDLLPMFRFNFGLVDCRMNSFNIRNHPERSTYGQLTAKGQLAAKVDGTKLKAGVLVIYILLLNML